MIKLLTNPKITLREALKLLEATGKKCVIIVNKKNKLLGTLTDGDLRNHILSGKKLDRTIEKVYNSKPAFFFQNKLNLKNAKKEIIKNRYELVPIVNEDAGKNSFQLCQSGFSIVISYVFSNFFCLPLHSLTFLHLPQLLR